MVAEVFKNMAISFTFKVLLHFVDGKPDVFEKSSKNIAPSSAAGQFSSKVATNSSLQSTYKRPQNESTKKVQPKVENLFYY